MSLDSFEEESQSVSSDSTVTAVEKPLLKTNALSTPMNTSRRSLSSASTAATILQVSQRTDETPGRIHADFFRGSGRLPLSPSRSNPNLYQQTENIQMESASLSRRESARSSSTLPPPPPYIHDSRVSTFIGSFLFTLI
jgi:hypothetical protein